MAVVGTVEGAGGVTYGGSADVAFVHGSGQVAAGLVVEWDLDGDGDFDDPLEDVTTYLMSAETLTGRDFASQLTGRAGPGRLDLTLLNDDGRFSFFNDASPLNTAPFSVRSGGRIRVRTADAVDPDDVPLARDRFRGTGALSNGELGNVWTTSGDATYTRGADSTGRTVATHTGAKGTLALAHVDVGAADFYAQTTMRAVDGDSSAGLIYRYEDDDNYGYVGVAAGLLLLGEYNAGVTTLTAFVDAERRVGTTIGVHVVGAVATVYLEGVPVIVDDAFSSSATTVGLFSAWIEQRPPAFDEFYVWDDLTVDPTDGVLWTGKVTQVLPTPSLFGPATVQVTAEGPLRDAAATDVDPPASIGDTSTSPGSRTGVLVGATLAAAGLLHPPGPLAEGVVLPGAFGVSRGKALDIARLAEEVELGFLHETQEGRIGFNERGARAGEPPAVMFTDDRAGQFGYTGIELGDWRSEVVNRVTASLAPGVPGLVTVFGGNVVTAAGVGNDITVTMPTNPPHDVVEGDLYVLVFASTVGNNGMEWETPIGWTSHRDGKGFVGKLRIYSKRLDDADLGTSVTFFDDTTTGGTWAFLGFLIRDWYGDVTTGIEVPEVTGYGSPNTLLQARGGLNRPPTVFPPWGPAPSLLLSVRGGMASTDGAVMAAVIDDHAPAGYGNASGSFVNGSTNAEDVGLEWAARDACVEVESPSVWATGADVFGGFNNVEVATIAVRGFAGDPPELSGGQVVEVNDRDSQDRYGAILPHENAAGLFATVDDAEAYGEGVLLRHSGDRPILTLTFAPTTTAAHAAQATRRRVGHKVRVVADGDARLGIDRDFYIETISHRVDRGGKGWETTWQLSPA